MDGYDYIRCETCDLIFQEGQTTPEVIAACYTGSRFKHWRRQMLNRFRKIENQRDFDVRMKRARGIFKYASAQVSVERGDYLDIGCNKGFNIYAAEEDGWLGHGIDFVEEILVPIQNSKPELKNRLKFGSFVDLGHTYKDNSFDLVTCIDVIEHLLEPKEAMQDMLRIAKSGGVVIYQTPDALPEYIKLGAEWKALKPNEHLLLFNKGNFRTMALNAGFAQVDFAEAPFDECDGNFVATCYKK